MLHKNTHVSGANKLMCPYCDKMVCCEDFENNHIKDCDKKATTKGALIKLPEKGSVMTFKNYKKYDEKTIYFYMRS